MRVEKLQLLQAKDPHKYDYVGKIIQNPRVEKDVKILRSIGICLTIVVVVSVVSIYLLK